MSTFSFDHVGFKVNGQDSYLLSGEFHYFRVPKADWKKRMALLKEAGGNCVATYVPWLIHEPTEGDIRFGDTDYRDLEGFLKTAQEMDLNVLLRPGPYQYSELEYGGLPRWLMRGYPEMLAKDIDGKTFHAMSVSYLHPVFLKKARAYYKAFADVVRPYMAQNGGPVAMLQVDNELTGIHVWFGSMDYNPDTIGFGDPAGRYPRWLERRYGAMAALNAAYGTDFQAFKDVKPVDKADKNDIRSCRRLRDYTDFYRATIAEYAVLLKSWLREDGLMGPICHNSANPNMNCQFPELVSAMGEDFLLGSDHYYTLNQSWPQNSPTPQYAIRALMSCDTMRGMGMPPSVMEMPGGSPSDTPPILKEDLLACYLCNAAVGAKGVNLYVYTGGPNVPDTGETADIYDYNAIIRADGAINETYESLKTFGDFCSGHAWMQRAQRASSVQIGYEWNMLRSEAYDDQTQPFTGAQAGAFLEKGLIYALMCSRFAPEMTLLTSALDISKPLIVPCPTAMSEEAQRAVADFIARGGQALLLPLVPTLTLDGSPCDILEKALGHLDIALKQTISPAVEVEGVGRVYGIVHGAVLKTLPEGAQVIARDSRTGAILGCDMPVGKGRVIWLGGTWEMSTWPQVMMLEALLTRLGAKACVRSDNRSIFTALWTGESGQKTLFIMNLYSGAQSTRITLGEEGRDLGVFDLKPMEVKVVDLA